jgi:hypothetical protein
MEDTVDPEKENMQTVAVLRQNRRSNWRLRLDKEIDDHGLWRLMIVGITVIAVAAGAGWALGGSKRPSLRYIQQSIRFLCFDLLGGEQNIDNALDIHNDIIFFNNNEYNAMDIMATSIYVLSNIYSKERFESILKKPGSRIRILVLDPRLGLETKQVERFSALADAFGDAPEITLMQCILSARELFYLSKEFEKYGKQFEVRFYRDRYAKAANGHFLLGRSYQKYSRANPNNRVDFLVPYDRVAEDGVDSPLRMAWRIKDMPDNPRVKAYSQAFEEIWRGATPMETVMKTLPSVMELKVKTLEGDRE